MKAKETAHLGHVGYTAPSLWFGPLSHIYLWLLLMLSRSHCCLNNYFFADNVKQVGERGVSVRNSKPVSQ